MAGSKLQAELDLILESVPSARPALTTLAEADDITKFGDAMYACAEIEAAMPIPSQGWRILWTQKAEDGIVRGIRKLMSVSEVEAANAYWIAAAGFSERVAASPDYFDPTPKNQVNIGWLLGTGQADKTIHALIVIFGEILLGTRSGTDT